MARRRRSTHFRRWYQEHGTTIAAFAVVLGCTEGSVRHYLGGAAIPRPEILRKLTTMTGLPLEAFLFPFEPLAGAVDTEGVPR